MSFVASHPRATAEPPRNTRRQRMKTYRASRGPLSRISFVHPHCMHVDSRARVPGVMRARSPELLILRRSMMTTTTRTTRLATPRLARSTPPRRIASSPRRRVVARASSSFGLVLPGDDAFERLRPGRRDDDDDDDDGGDDGDEDAYAAALEGLRQTAPSPEPRVDASPSRNRRELVARWRVAARFGRKAAARDALRLWARTIGVKAGVSSERFQVCSGYIGGRESALEMRVGGFGGLGEVETFLRGVPRDEHVEWGKAFGEHIVDGTPEWVIMEVCGVEDGVGGDGSGVVGASSSSSAETAETVSAARTTYQDDDEIDESLLIPGTTLPDGRRVVADWKGDPMVLNPGDRMPRF